MKSIGQEMFPPLGTRSEAGDSWLVMKFGEAGVSTAESWSTITALIRERLASGFRPVIVHSALAGVSDRLAELLTSASSGEREAAVGETLAIHYNLAGRLGLDGQAILEGDANELRHLLRGVGPVSTASPRVQVKVLALGAVMATRLSTAFLRLQGVEAHWIDAGNLLRSVDLPDETERARFLSAACDVEPDSRMPTGLLPGGGVPVTQGFHATNPRGETVRVGGGSDAAAAYIAAKLEARGLEILTDVPGLFSADPRVVAGARLLRTLSYDEAQEIVSTGGSVLHPRCIPPVRHHHIPVRVRCTDYPESAGTLISQDPGSSAPRVTAISSRSGITVVSMETVGMWQEVGFLANAFACFRDLGLSVALISTAESNVTVTLDAEARELEAASLEQLRGALERFCQVQIIENAEVVSLVGRKIRAMLHVIGPALEVFEEHRIHLLSQAANDLNLSFVVEGGQALRLIRKLHALLVRPGTSESVFGTTWEEMKAPEPTEDPKAAPWWVVKRSRLLDVVARESSAYVYDVATVREACERISALRNVDRVFYAIKANSHSAILQTIDDCGLSFECVSPGEIQRVLEVCPGLDPQRILFTPNFAPRSEYGMALEAGVRVTLDNLHPLRHWGELFSGHDLFLRLDTGTGRGHHKHVRTAGVHSKFGIPLFEMTEAQSLIESSGATVVGLHAHAGSGILEADNWREIADVLLETASAFPKIEYLNLGGGLGVPEKPGQHPLDMGALDASLREIRDAAPEIELWLEPGRYLVAEAGVLLTRITQMKGKGEVQYVGVSTGMNSLIRPALYGSYHEIVNLTRLDAPADQLVNVVGPNCETGDRLGNDRLLPTSQEGDVLLIANAGAYGYVMSSRYNLREPAVEVVI